MWDRRCERGVRKWKLGERENNWEITRSERGGGSYWGKRGWEPAEEGLGTGRGEVRTGREGDENWDRGVGTGREEVRVGREWGRLEERG